MLNKCGKPTSKEVTGDETTGYYREKSRERGYTKSFDTGSIRTTYGKKQSDTFGSYTETSEIIETWQYNCGSHDFNWILTFTGSSLTNIETTSYGSGDSDCIGAEARKEREVKRKKERYEQQRRQSQENLEIRKKPNAEPSFNQAETKGKILISGTPPNARVYLDGNHLSHIPCTLYDIKAGPHILEVKKSGYVQREEEVNVIAGETLQIMIRLEEE